VNDLKKSRITARKMPKQARSGALVDAILEAAIRVLAEEGAQRFTSARVAERAGVSVGSLYQYFPNKAAILFKLQSDEWRQTSDLLQDILKDRSLAPLERLRRLVRAFLRSEFEEVAIRTALNDAAPLYRNAPEAQDDRETGAQTMREFMREALPVASEAEQLMAAELIMTTLGPVGKRFSEAAKSLAEVDAYAEAMADMFCRYLEGDLTK